jgi:hypothetical protein
MSQTATTQRGESQPTLLGVWQTAPATVIGSLDQVTTGSVVIKPGTPLPHALTISLRRIGPWNLLADLSASEFDRILRRERWHLFFVVPPVEAWGLALSFHTALGRAQAVCSGRSRRETSMP